MGFKTHGKGFLGWFLTDGATFDLVTSGGTTPSASYNYNSRTAYFGKWPDGLTDEAKEKNPLFSYAAADMTVGDYSVLKGQIYNTNEFVFDEADDPTYDYSSGTVGGGWGNISKYKLTKIINGTACESTADITDSSGTPISVNIQQDYQVRFKAGAIRLTFNITETQGS